MYVQEAVKETILELETLSLTPAEERSAGDTATHVATPVTNGLSRESIEGRYANHNHKQCAVDFS